MTQTLTPTQPARDLTTPAPLDQQVTPKQEAFITTLLAEREGYTEGFKARVLTGLRTKAMTKAQASKIIEWLLERPKPAKPAVEAVGVVDGIDLRPLEAITSKGLVRLAVPDSDTRLKLRFKFTKSGTIYVDDAAEYGYGRNYGRQYPGKAYAGAARDEIEKILADPKAAAIKYCEITGKCAICGRHLEHEVSVAEGIGPVCRGRLGM